MLREKNTPKGLKQVFFLAKAENIPQDWLFENVSTMGEVVGGGTPDTTIQEYWNGDIAWAVPSDMTALKSNFIASTERRITRHGLENSSAKLLPAGTVLITSRATIGECAINRVPMATNQGFQSLICNDAHYNHFMLYAFKFNKSKLMRLAYGTTFLEIPKTEIKKIRIAIPPKEEQQKIASILSKVDDLIQKTEEVIDHMRRFKKGLMQRLLTRGIGHSRFRTIKWHFGKLMEIPEEWEISLFGDLIVDFIGGGTPSTNVPQYWNGKIHWMRSAAINKRFVISGEKFISEEGLTNSASHIVPKDNLLMATRVSIGNVAINKIDIAISQDLTGLVLDKTKVSLEYAYWVMRASENQLLARAQGTIIKGITREDMATIKILVPTLQEQRKIACILDTIDFIEEKLVEYHEKLEILKKGLLQKLLTGQIRVKV